MVALLRYRGSRDWGTRMSICTLVLQVELLPDRDPDNDGTKISVSVIGTRDRGGSYIKMAKKAQGEH